MKAWMIVLLILTADIGVIVSLGFGILNLALPLPDTALLAFGTIEAVLLLAFIPFLFFVNWRTITDGANDNLTSCYLGMSILKEMADQGERLEHTDVCCLVTDGEESGLRGALCYAKAHRQELMDTNTLVIAADTIHDANELMIYHRGVNFTQQNSREVCELLHRAGLSCGVDLPYTGFYLGATDAEAFSRYGIKAAALCAVSHKPSFYYHTRFDTWDNLDEGCIELTRNILKSAITLYDTGWDE
jgi:putative aminopeptidase FrvX